MPVELQIIRASEFICLDADEQLDFDESKQVLRNLAEACRKRGVDRALLDVRGMPVSPKPRFTPSQLAELVRTFHEAGFGKHQRLAVLYKTDPHGGARMFAFISRIQGWQVRAFTEFEEALLWLSEVTGKGATRQQEVQIPITTKRPRESKSPQLGLPPTGHGRGTTPTARRISNR
jgi:hypothetical protein